jgi:hypothetical protein
LPNRAGPESPFWGHRRHSSNRTIADPGAIARVLEQFHNLNITQRRIHAQLASNDLLHVEVDVFGIDSVNRRLIAAKLAKAMRAQSSLA